MKEKKTVAPAVDAGARDTDAIAIELWKAADSCGFEQFREAVRAALSARASDAAAGAPTFDAKHVSLKQKGDKIILTLELDGLEGAPRYRVTPINPAVVRSHPAIEPKATGDAIARSKRILALVDDYEVRPTKDNRDAIRHALLEEFSTEPPKLSTETVDNPVDIDPKALTDRVRALFQPWPEGELGPTDEPESQYRLGYNTAIEDAIDALLNQRDQPC